MKKVVLLIIRTSIISMLVFIMSFQPARAENLSETFRDMSVSYGQNYMVQYDRNSDGVINIFDFVLLENQMQSIDITKLKNNYVQIVSPEDKAHYTELGMSFFSDRAFPVTDQGIDLFAYVDAAEGLELEVIEGGNYFRLENGYLYLNPGQASSVARVRLKNSYALSEEFLIYGTRDREMHDFTYDYLMKLLEEQVH